MPPAKPETPTLEPVSRRFLLKAGVGYLQGYYFGRPALQRHWPMGASITPVPLVAE